MTTSSLPIRRKHMSGRFTATPHEEQQAIDLYLDGTDIFSTTEIDANARARCLREPGFHAVFGNKGGRDDTGLAIRTSRFDVLESGTQTLSPLTYITERGDRSDTTEGAYAVVKDKHTLSPRIGVIVVVHMPHGMQDEVRSGRYDSDVARAYRGILLGARRLANGLAHTYHADWVEIVGDWNLNLRAAWVQSYLKVQFPRYQVNFRKPYPRKGTFHDEVIDLALLWGVSPVARPRIIPPQPGFDHGGWAEVNR